MKGVALFVALFLLSVAGFSQDADYNMSAPLEMSQSGWNKILQVRNGNTILFHFEDKKGVLVKVFDEKYKEIASELHTGSSVDFKALDRSFYDGLYEIGDEAVLFLTQQSAGKETLYRIRFNTATGKIVSEDNITAQAAFRDNTTAFILKEYSEDIYYTLAFTKTTVEDAAIDLLMYSDKHELLKKIPLEMVKKGYDNMHLLNQQVDKSGSVLLTVELNKTVSANEVEKYLVLYYLPKNANKFNAKILKLPASAKDFNVNYADNTYAETVNIFLSALSQSGGVGEQPASIFYYQMLMIADHEMNSLNQVQLNNSKLIEGIKKRTNTTEAAFAGNIVSVQADNKGNTIVVSEDLLSVNENKGDNAAYVGVTVYDYEGTEKWAELLPRGLHDNSSYKQDASEAFKVRTGEYELSRILCISTKGSTYVVFNELESNFNKQPGNNFDYIRNFDKTQAVYYKLNRKNELTKAYLFGTPTAGEYMQAYPNSGSFNKRKNIYATLVLNRKTGKMNTHVAWRKMDN
jgi:hypothetical protein